MQRTRKTSAGHAFSALSKQTVEPVFGIIKSMMGFGPFLMRGLENVHTEWTLVTMAWNLHRMAVLRPTREDTDESVPLSKKTAFLRAKRRFSAQFPAHVRQAARLFA